MIEGEQIPTILAVCAMIATFAIVLLAVCAVAVLLSVRKANARLMEFVDRWQPVAESAQQTVADFAEHSGELLSRLNQLTAVLHKQTLQLDSMLSRLLATAQGNVEGADATVRKTLEAVNSTVEALEQSVQVPKKKLRALAAGMSAAMQRLSKGQPEDPGRISTDEEMFI